MIRIFIIRLMKRGNFPGGWFVAGFRLPVASRLVEIVNDREGTVPGWLGAWVSWLAGLLGGIGNDRKRSEKVAAESQGLTSDFWLLPPLN